MFHCLVRHALRALLLAFQCMPAIAPAGMLASAAIAFGQSESMPWSALAYPAGVESLPPSTPEPAAEWTLPRLEQRALASNPSLHRMAALLGASQGERVQAGLWPNPSIGYEGQQLGSGGLAEQHGVLFSQEIVRGGKLRLSRAVADREVVRLEQELSAQRQRVLTDVRIAYYQVLIAQKQMELIDNLIRISSEGSAAVEGLFRAGDVGRADVLQAQLEIETSGILAENARNRHAAAWRSLAAVVGEPQMAPLPLAGDITEAEQSLEFQTALDHLLSTSPEVSAAAAEVDRARMALERARVEPIPNVQFEGLVNWIDNGIGGKPDGGVAVSMPVPIFNRNQGAITRAEHELIAASQALEQLQLDLQNRLAPIFEQYANARHQVQRYRENILPAAEESLNLSRQTYRAGESNYTVLLTSQRTYAQVQLNYLDSLRSLKLAEIEINGLLLSGSLQHAAAAPNADPFRSGGANPSAPVNFLGR